jgi:hypothetical protein
MLRFHVIVASCGAALLGCSLAGIVADGSALGASDPAPCHAHHGHRPGL